MSISKSQRAEEKKRIFGLEIVQKNRVFSLGQISMLYDLFELFSDRSGTVDIRQIVTIAQTLHLQSTYPFIFHGLRSISEGLNGERVTFENMLLSLCEMLGDPSFEEGRLRMFQFIDRQNQGRLSFGQLKKLAHMIGQTITDQQIDEIIIKVAGEGKKDISPQSFLKYIQKSYLKKNAV